jgi:hypothetical protein
MQSVCFVKYPTALFFSDRKTYRKQTPLNKNISFELTGTRTTVIYNYQPQAQLHYFFHLFLLPVLKVLARSSFKNYLDYCITLILFEYLEIPITQSIIVRVIFFAKGK